MNRRCTLFHLAVVTVTLGLVLAGCSDDPDSRATASGAVTSAEAASPTARPLTGNDSAITPGTYQFSFLGTTREDTPAALVDVPAGFVQADEGNDWYIVSGEEAVFLGLWTVVEVERDACLRPRHDGVTPGPSVEDLVDALAAQGSTGTTTPTPVTLAGYDGLRVDVTGPGDTSRCGRFPALWREPGERGIYSDDQVDQLWILDVDGLRLVVDASYGPTATAAERDALTAMVASLQLMPAE